MNIYARFFDNETVAHSVEQLVEFFQSLPDIQVTQQLVDDLNDYANNNMPYPKRYKIRPRVYFILIKTNAESLEEFKANRKTATAVKVADPDFLSPKSIKASALTEMNQGWYRGSFQFKRVLQIPGTGKFQYQDTDFEAYVFCNNGQECYNRMVAHLKNRTDIDMRSQFPSAKGSNFDFEFIGEELPEEIQLQIKEDEPEEEQA